MQNKWGESNECLVYSVKLTTTLHFREGSSNKAQHFLSEVRKRSELRESKEARNYKIEY